MFQQTCVSLQRDPDIDNYDFISTPNSRLVVEFGYQTLCATLTPVILFDSRYGRRGSRVDDPPDTWYQDFYAKEQWSLTRYCHRREVALQAADVLGRLVSERVDWPRQVADTALTSTLLRLLDSNKGDDECDLCQLVVNVLNKVAVALKDKEPVDGGIQHYFLDGVNVLAGASGDQLKPMARYFKALADCEENLIAAFEE